MARTKSRASRAAAHPGGATQRQLRVGEELRHVVARLLERGALHDPELAGVPITVTEVRVSPDLKNATVFVMPLGGRDAAQVLPALKRASAYLRGLVAQEVQLRHAPRLGFALDTSFDQHSRIDRILREIGPIAPAKEDGDGA